MNIQALIGRINDLDIKVRYAIFGLGVLLAAGLDYVFILRLQINDLKKISTEIETLSTDTVHIKGEMQRINEIKKGLEGMRSRLQALNNKIRSVREVPSILEDISRMANACGVKIDQLSPAKQGQELLMTNPDAKYYALPIVISAHCGYHVFGRFLNKLEQGSLLFLVRDLRMEGNDKDAGSFSIAATLKVILADRTPEPKK